MHTWRKVTPFFVNIIFNEWSIRVLFTLLEWLPALDVCTTDLKSGNENNKYAGPAYWRAEMYAGRVA